MNMKHNQGFTLAELMVTLAVFSVLVTVGVPSFNQTLLNNRQVSSLNILVGSMQLARSEAIVRNRRVTLCGSGDGQTCGNTWSNGWIVFVDASGDGQVNGGEVIIRSVNDVSRLGISSDGIATSLRYRPNGRMMTDNNIHSNTGQFTVCDIRGAEHARTIVVDSSGRPRASKYNIDGSAPAC